MTLHQRPRAVRPAMDFQAHLAALEAGGLLIRVERPINKDTQLHPLVRWQFLGGLPEDERKAFLFTHVVDSKGRRYDMPVVLGALAASPRIYAAGMGRSVAVRYGAASKPGVEIGTGSAASPPPGRASASPVTTTS